MVGRPLLPWQEWLVIHAGELREDGLPRHRVVLIMVARQNGKTTLARSAILFWQVVDRVPMVVATSTKLDTAKETVWEPVVQHVENNPRLSRYVPRGGIRRANGEQKLSFQWGSDFKIAAANEEGGRGFTIDRLVLDELRQHHTRDAWNASEPATLAVPDSQIFCFSNAGDDDSIVLNDLRARALAGEEGLAIFEWSSEGEPDDLEALAQANPSMGYTIAPERLLAMGRGAKAAGGLALAGFLTEHMCRRVRKLDPAIDPDAWERCADPAPLREPRSRIALCFDIAADQQHATLYAAAVQADGRARVEPVGDWSGPTAPAELRDALPRLVGIVRPRALGWYPGGPAAAIAAQMARRQGWPPRGTTFEELRSGVPAVCMGFNEQVTATQIAHSRDPLLDAQVATAERLQVGDGWRFIRKGAGHVDAAYAAAGAVHIARQLQTTRPFVVVAGRK